MGQFHRKSLNTVTMSTPKEKKAIARKNPLHPTYDVMVMEAIKTLKERKGSSRQAIIKYINSNYKISDKKPEALAVQVRLALKRETAKGNLTNPKGPNGSFKISKAGAEDAPKPKTKRKKKSAGEKKKKPKGEKKAKRKSKAKKPAAE